MVRTNHIKLFSWLEINHMLHDAIIIGVVFKRMEYTDSNVFCHIAEIEILIPDDIAIDKYSKAKLILMDVVKMTLAFDSSTMGDLFVYSVELKEVKTIIEGRKGFQQLLVYGEQYSEQRGEWEKMLLADLVFSECDINTELP